MSQYPHVKFLLGAWQPAQFPDDQGVEVAVVGRSNAGKSSAINVLLNRRDLARTSKTPGLTQQINFFELAPGRRLVDLPGYGYAKVPAKVQEHWRQLMTRYFEIRQSLAGIMVVMDARRPLLELDWQMLEWVRARGLAAHLLLTKSDKLSRDEAARTLRRVQAEAGTVATAQLFSSPAKAGVEEAQRALERLLVASCQGNEEGRGI